VWSTCGFRDVLRQLLHVQSSWGGKLDLRDISPRLASLTATSALIPCASGSFAVRTFEPSVQVVPENSPPPPLF
jgi:hypothetical protein